MVQGLTDQEVAERRSRGLGNSAPPSTARTVRDILRANIFTSINLIIFSIALALAVLGNLGDAITSGGLVFINAVVGIIQELRAKRQLDRIALLNQPKALVLRRVANGADARADARADAPADAAPANVELAVDPSELVKDDLLVLKPGEQAVLDGVIVDGTAEVDESLLTGESDLIVKQPGDAVLSGSFCVTGRAIYRAERVGMHSYANQLTGKARAFKAVKTPLQREIDFVLRLLMMIALVIGFMMFVSSVVNNLPTLRSVQAAAVIAGIVPNGLVMAILVAYSLGAVRIARQGALVQQTNAIESLSHVDVLCTDKTGTLTANRIRYHSCVPLDADEATLLRAAAAFAHSGATANRTSEALALALSGRRMPVADEVPFSSARKWSAIAFDADDLRGAFVMGAPDVLRDHLRPGHDFDRHMRALAEQGLRVLLFAHRPDVIRLHDGRGEVALPQGLIPLGLLIFDDELRPEARETVERFRKAGVQLKVISGDDPDTVAALARQAGFPADVKSYSGLELAAMSSAEFTQAAEEGTIFGRITPEQKERLVDALQSRGRYVAMIGDGVNDVLALKKAKLGIAMQSGTSATRGVADMVLLDDSFAALVPALSEGRRIVNGMRDILSLFLTRCFYVALIIIATGFVGVGFPFGPRNITLLTLLTVGIPTIALAYWAEPAVVRGRLLRSVWSFVIPAALSVLVFGLVIYVITFGVVDGRVLTQLITPSDIAAFQEAVAGAYQVDVSTPQRFSFEVANIAAQSIITLFSLMSGLMLVVFIRPPFRFLAGGRPYSGDKRMTVLALGLFVIFVLGWNITLLRRFFAVAIPPDLAVLATILAFTAVWAATLLLLWKQRWFERFLLGRNVVPPAAPTSVEPAAADAPRVRPAQPARTMHRQS